MGRVFLFGFERLPRLLSNLRPFYDGRGPALEFRGRGERRNEEGFE